jgi:hypothetical protein
VGITIRRDALPWSFRPVEKQHDWRQGMKLIINSRIRFLEPIDPRAVFNFAAALVNMPERNFRYRGSESMHFDDWWPLNPRIRTVDGADVSVVVEYGAEGSLLVEEWDAYPEYAHEYPLAQRGPRGYVLLDFQSSGGHLYEKHSDWVAAVLANWPGLSMSLQDDRKGTWSPLVYGGARR